MMNTISMSGYRAIQRLHPLSLLAQLTSRHASGCLQVTNGEMSWDLYLDRGRLLYASSSADPFERLDRHLRRMSNQVFSLVSAIRVQVRLLFENSVEETVVPDYQAICWLVEQQHLTLAEASILIEELAKEVIETVLPVRSGHCHFTETSPLTSLPQFCQLDLRPIIDYCQEQLRRRQVVNRPIVSNLAPFHSEAPSPATNGSTTNSSTTNSSTTNGIVSPANGSAANLGLTPNSAVDPSVSNISNSQNAPANGTVSKVTNVLNPYPVVRDTLLRSPKNQQPEKVVEAGLPSESFNFIHPEKGLPVQAARPALTHRIACIDDSPTVLQVIKTYLESLDEQSFSVILINDPVKALMQIVRSKPDLILLDVTMPGLDGYELCSLLRRHPNCKQTPIIMVTGNTGFVDRARAKLVGASGYLTKPFTQSDIIKTVFKHLSIS
jgi:two-component system, chemotaxis family, response regulator PixG